MVHLRRSAQEEAGLPEGNGAYTATQCHLREPQNSLLRPDVHTPSSSCGWSVLAWDSGLQLGMDGWSGTRARSAAAGLLLSSRLCGVDPVVPYSPPWPRRRLPSHGAGKCSRFPVRAACQSCPFSVLPRVM